MGLHFSGDPHSIFEKIEKKCMPHCQAACPANINIQAYISLISQGRYKYAFEVIRKSIPFPAVCGRVCFSPCEDACLRSNVDSPLSIRLLKRLVTDTVLKSANETCDVQVQRTREERVAVVGSGPAGLTAAWELSKLGYPVTIFESLPKLGGMMRYCIPKYRLPDTVLESEIAYILNFGVDARTNITIGRDLSLEDLREQGYSAVFIAVGAIKSRSLGIDGEDSDGVFHALEFLSDVRTGRRTSLDGRVAIIGGGDVAIDAARTAIRLGASEVNLIYRRSRDEMPAHVREVDEAELEGVKFQFLSNPTRVIDDGERVNAIECIRMRLGEPDTSGRARPIPIEGSEHLMHIEAVIVAIGETPDLSFLPDGVKVSPRNLIEVDSISLQTDVPWVFSGGDVVTGPASVIDAIGAGKRAARFIHIYLRGYDLSARKESEIEEKSWVVDWEDIAKKQRQEAFYTPPELRRNNFDEVELGLTGDIGILEAYRCLKCGPCSECLVKEELCEADCAEVDKDLCVGCGVCVSICPFDAVKKDEIGIATVDEDVCKGCGACAASCPMRAITMRSLTDDYLIEILAQ